MFKYFKLKKELEQLRQRNISLTKREITNNVERSALKVSLNKELSKILIEIQRHNETKEERNRLLEEIIQLKEILFQEREKHKKELMSWAGIAGASRGEVEKLKIVNQRLEKQFSEIIKITEGEI